MIKSRHYFLESVNQATQGKEYEVWNKSTDTIMVISASGATSCKIEFYGKATGCEDFIRINAIKSSDYSMVEEGNVNEAYIIDCSSWEKINVSVANISGGDLTVIGEVIY